MYTIYLMKRGKASHTYKIGETGNLANRKRQLAKQGFYVVASFDLASTKAESLLIEAIVRWKLSKKYQHQPLDRFITKVHSDEMLADFTQAVAMATKLISEG